MKGRQRLFFHLRKADASHVSGQELNTVSYAILELRNAFK